MFVLLLHLLYVFNKYLTMLKKTLVLGASLKPNRYSNIAINMLRNYHIEVVAIGLRNGIVNDVEIITSTNHLKAQNIDTITLYLNAKRQQLYYDFILNLKPRRVIFNPGTENLELIKLLEKHHINYEIACTLVLLRTGQY